METTWGRWERAGNRDEPTKWHAIEPTHHDDDDRVACGKRFARRRKLDTVERPTLDTAVADICRSCLRAVQR